MYCNLEVSVYEIQSRYCIQFWTNTYGESMNSMSHPIYMLQNITIVFFMDGFVIK